MSSPVVGTRNVLKRNWMRFAATLLAALASFVAGPNAALAAAPQHHDQGPGFYRLKVGDLEVTVLFDGPGVFDPHWLNGTKATMDGVVKALHEDPHMLDVDDTGFLVNTGKQLILVDAGAGTWWGGGALGRLAGSLRSAGYTPEEVGIVLVTHLHSDHVGGLTTQDGKRVFPNADVYFAQAESDFRSEEHTTDLTCTRMPISTFLRSLRDAGDCLGWGGGALGRLAASLRSAGYTPEEVGIVLVTHLHSDHVGGLTTQDGKRVFPNADVYVAQAESDFWLSPEIAAKAPKDAQPFFQSAQAITAPYIKAGKWHTFSGPEPLADGTQIA